MKEEIMRARFSKKAILRKSLLLALQKAKDSQGVSAEIELTGFEENDGFEQSLFYYVEYSHTTPFLEKSRAFRSLLGAVLAWGAGNGVIPLKGITQDAEKLRLLIGFASPQETLRRGVKWVKFK
jgi:hypothetical protein